MAVWTILNQHKKNAVEIMFFYKDGRVIKKEEGFRWGRWSCESDTKPEIDLVNEDGFEIGTDDYNWEMDEMIDGCWSEWTYPDDMTEEEQEAFEAAWEEDFFEGVEALGWSQDDCEMWIYGPIQLEDDQGNVVGQGEPDNEVPPMPELPDLTFEEKAELVRELEAEVRAEQAAGAKWPFSPPNPEPEEPEMTDWFPVSTKPAYKGFYEVLTKESINWPFPNKAEWTGKKWVFLDQTVTEWRGLAKKPE